MTADKPWRDRETLQRLYNDEVLSLREIGDRLGCPESTVFEWMVRLGVGTNAPGGDRGDPSKSNTLVHRLLEMDPDEVGEPAPDGDDRWREHYGQA